MSHVNTTTSHCLHERSGSTGCLHPVCRGHRSHQTQLPAHRNVARQIIRPNTASGASPTGCEQPVLPIHSIVIGLSLLLLATHVSADIINPLGGSPKAASAEKPTTELLTKAKKSLLENRVDECRKEIAAAREQNADLVHTDVLMAEWLFEAGKMAPGIQLLEQLAVAEPDRIDLRLMFARLAVNQGRLFDAWTHVSAAEQCELPAAWSDKFRNQQRHDILTLKAHIASRRADWKTAKTLYTDLFAQHNKPRDELELAKALFHLKGIEEAETHIRHACESEDIKAIPELVLASLSEQTQDIKACEDWFRRGLKLDGDRGRTVSLEFARWLIRNNRPDDVLSVLAKVKASEETQDDIRFVMALAHRMAGDMTSAETVLSALHQKTPASFPISNQLALVLVESADEAKRGRALQIATSNARRFQNNEDALSTLGWVQYRLGDGQTAEQILTATMADGSVSRDTAYYLSEVKEALGKTEEATTLAQAATNGSGEFFNRLNNTTTHDVESP